MNNDQNGNGKNKGRNKGRRGGRGRDGGVHAKGEQMELLFAEQQFGRQTKVICYLGDGTVIYPATRRFKPRPGRKYLCDVRFVGQGNKTGLARPTLPYTLSPEEWVPDSALRTVLVSELVFEEQVKNGRKRFIAFDNGQAVFPDHGTEVTVGKPRAYMLRERGTVSFAIALPDEARSGGTGLVKMAEKLQEWSPIELQYVVVKRAVNKNGVAMARSENEIDVVQEYRKIYDILGVADDVEPDQIRKAFKEKSKDVHPDRVSQAWSRDGKEPPLLVKKNMQFFFEALTEAKDRAIEAYERPLREEAERKQRSSESGGDAKASSKKPRKRKPRKAKAEKEAPKAAEPAETTSVETATEEQTPAPKPEPAPAEPKAEEPVVETASETEDTATEDGEQQPTTEDGDPIGDDGKVYGKYTVEEWAELSEGVKKFSRRYGKAASRSSSPSSASPKPASSEAATSGSSTQAKQPQEKGDWKAQLSQLKNKS